MSALAELRRELVQCAAEGVLQAAREAGREELRAGLDRVLEILESEPVRAAGAGVRLWRESSWEVSAGESAHVAELWGRAIAACRWEPGGAGGNAVIVQLARAISSRGEGSLRVRLVASLADQSTSGEIEEMLAAAEVLAGSDLSAGAGR